MILRSTVPCTFLLQLVALRLRAGVITHLSNCSVWLSSNEENFSVQDMYSRLSSCRVQTKNQQRRELIASDNRLSTAEFKRRTGTKRTFCSGGGTSGGRLGEWHAASNLRSLNCSPPNHRIQTRIICTMLMRARAWLTRALNMQHAWA